MSAIDLLQQVEQRVRERQLFRYRPYGHPDTLCPDGELWKAKNAEGEWCEWSNKPWQLEFHNAGAENQERMLMAANRPGKTRTAAHEVAFHMTGLYPEWWKGRRFDKPVSVWTGSPTNETSREIVQKELLGGTTATMLGTGAIPRECITGKPSTRQAGISDVVEMFKVRHVSGGESTCVLKTYEQGWRKWQGTAPEVIWMDEEPEDNEQQGRIRTEALTRLLTSRGIMMVTFTPLLGQTAMVRHFQSGGKGVWLGTATWDDAPHILPEERERMMASYPEHERGARTRGVPMLGEGKVFPYDEEEIKIAPFPIPPYYALIKGIDFGLDHPAAVVDLAWDRDTDILYLTRAWKKRNADLNDHITAINATEPSVPVAWPHDGANREKSNGIRLKSNYRAVKMLGRSARYKNDKGGAQPKEPIIQELNDRIARGGFKVFSTCFAFFDEFNNYHRKNGELSKLNDDVLKAVFYAIMMRRYAMPLGYTTANRAYSAPAQTSVLSMRH